MIWRRRPTDADRRAELEVLYAAHDDERARLAEALADLKAQVRALRTERDRTGEVKALEQRIEQMKLEKDRLTEAQDRKLRETEHRVGLLRTAQEHEVANATREAKLAVREENLDADKTRFEEQQKFEREHLSAEITRVDRILQSVLERLPNVTATYHSSVRGKAGEGG